MMELGKEGAFSINVYSPGNLIAQEITINGNVSLGGDAQHNGFSDEQIAQAIRAINGDKKPLNSKQKWAAVYWCLRWYCNFPKNTKEFCDRIDKLPLGELEYECDYNNIRRICSLSFMNEDARHLDKISPSRSEADAYMQCREVVVALAAELGRAALPQVQI